MCFHCEPSPSALGKEWFPLISSAVVIILFIIDRVINAELRKKQIQREWYLKVVIDPNLESLKKLFLDLRTSGMDSVNKLIASKNIPHLQYLNLKSRLIGDFQKIKREFDFDFIVVLNSYDRSLGARIISVLMSMEDDVTMILDSNSLGLDDAQAVEDTLTSYKASLLRELYSPLGG